MLFNGKICTIGPIMVHKYTWNVQWHQNCVLFLINWKDVDFYTAKTFLLDNDTFRGQIFGFEHL